MTDARHPVPPNEPTPDLERYVSDFGNQFLAATTVAAAQGAPHTHAADAAPQPRPRDRRARPARHPRRRPFRLVGIAAATLVVVAVGAVALPILPSPAPKAVGPLDVVAEARAALGNPGEIVHYAVTYESTFQGFGAGDDGGKCSTAKRPLEAWQATGSEVRWRMKVPGPGPECEGGMYRPDGTEVVGDWQQSRTATTSTTYTPSDNRIDVLTELPSSGPDAYAGLPGVDTKLLAASNGNFVEALRGLLASGKLKASRPVVQRGRRVVVLTGVRRDRSGKGSGRLIVEHRLRYVVDAASFAPVRLTSNDTTFFFKGNGRPKDGSFGSSYTTIFTSWEVLPATPENEKLLTIRPARPATTHTQTATEAAAENAAVMKRENAEGRRNAARTNAVRKRREAAGR